MKDNYERRLRKILKLESGILIHDLSLIQLNGLKEIYLEICLCRLKKLSYNIHEQDKELIQTCYDKVIKE